MITVGTDCSGIDAPIFAFKKLRIPISHEFSCDIDKFAKQSILANFKPKVFFDDIHRDHKREAIHTTFYFLGFPCQAFSSAGKRLGFNDNRGNIFFEGLKHIQHAKPKCFVLENVKGLITHKRGNTFKTILSYLKSLKIYNIYFKVLNSKNFGVAQNRERIFIVGILKTKQKQDFIFPIGMSHTPNISMFLDSKYNKSNKYKCLSKYEKNTIHYHYLRFKEKYNINIHENNYVLDAGASPQFSSIMKDISPCLKASRCDYYLTKYKRKLAPYECLRLQGFPNSFKQVVTDKQLYKQAGNSITVNILADIIKNIMISLN